MEILDNLDKKVEKKEEKIEKEYHVSWFIIAFKLVTGISELVSGIAIFLLGRPAFLAYRTYLSEELIDESHGFLARTTARILPYIAANHTTFIFYLIILGVAKTAGAIGLIYGKDWGADLLIFLTLILFPFQVVELILRPSLIEVGYIFIGIFIALYLVNFKPQDWAKKIVRNTNLKRNKP